MTTPSNNKEEKCACQRAGFKKHCLACKITGSCLCGIPNIGTVCPTPDTIEECKCTFIGDTEDKDCTDCPIHRIRPTSTEKIQFLKQSNISKEILSFNFVDNILKIDLTPIVENATDFGPGKHGSDIDLSISPDNTEDWFSEIKGIGSTPEEAVSRLWLELQK